jgi:hypothetical protein
VCECCRWATLACPFTDVEGVGDAPDSYAYDGKRVKKWNVSCDPYGQPWVPGDVIGCCLDMEVSTTTTPLPLSSARSAQLHNIPPPFPNVHDGRRERLDTGDRNENFA